MKQNRITPEQLFKLIIKESEEINNLNKTIKISTDNLNELISKNLKTPLSLNTIKLEEIFDVFYKSLEINNKSQEHFLERFEEIFKKEKKNYFWLKFGLIISSFLLVSAMYFVFTLNLDNKKLKSNQDIIVRFLDENPKAMIIYNEWFTKESK